MMYKACPNCGKIHNFNAGRCYVGKVSKTCNTFEQKIRDTGKYKKLARIIKEDSNGICSVCLDKGIINDKEIQVHHIEKIKLRPDLAFDETNVVCLCHKHHELAEVGLLSKKYLKKLVKFRKNCLK